MDNKLLFIIDEQYDFIEGGKLGVNGGINACKNTVKLLENNNFKLKLLTCDFHPFNHSSFKEFGGQWSSHCVEHTHGASIYEDVLCTAFKTTGITKILTKGTFTDTEEYSIFNNPYQSLYLQQMLSLKHFNEVHICGIAAEYCVLNTLKDLIKYVDSNNIYVHLDCIAAIESMNTLIDFCYENKINIIS